jgi:hypothetical protein
MISGEYERALFLALLCVAKLPSALFASFFFFFFFFFFGFFFFILYLRV